MSVKRFLWLVVFLPLFLCTCKDDESDSKDLNEDDPRISLVKMGGNSQIKFVINDTESLIYNYDSLAYGTDLKNVKFFFYGYVSIPKVQYKHEGDDKWTNFENGGTIDMSSPVSIHSISQDGSHEKIYRLDLRVHKYDVSAFTWQKISEIDINEKIISQKSLIVGNEWLWLVSLSGGENYCFHSVDEGISWKQKSVDVKNINWNTLSLWSDSLWVQDTDGLLYVSPSSSMNFVRRDLSIDRLLFTIGDKLLGIKGNSVMALGYGMMDFEEVGSLPSSFSVDNMISFVAPSGSTLLGYIYVLQQDGASVWSMDYKGHLYQLVENGILPSLEEPMVWNIDKTLGIIGGRLSDGSFSSKCYTSNDCGVTWTEDWHKSLNDEMLDLTNAGIFVLSKYGEIVIVGGNYKEKSSKTIWKATLNKLLADDLNYKD